MWQSHEYHVSFTISSSGGQSYFVPLVGLCAGVGFFTNGFWNYRKLRLIQDTPQIPVRSIAMGLVHVHGKVTGSNLLTSPVARLPCYYYRVRLESWDDRGKRQGWHTIRTDTERRAFYVDDGTGKVLVNPQSAEFDLPVSYRAEVGPKAGTGPFFDPTLGAAAVPTEQELHAYAAKATRPRFVGSPQLVARREAEYTKAMEGKNPLVGGGSFRITEHCLIAEHEYDFIGTCAQNPQPQEDGDQNVILRGRNEKTFIISGLTERALEKTLRKRALFRIVLGAVLIIFTLAVIIAELLKS